MDLMVWALPLLCHAAVVALCAYLLVRGVTHLFVGLFAAGELLQMLRVLAFIAIQRSPGGFTDNTRLMPAVNAVGTIGMLLFVAGFVGLTAHLLRGTSKPPSI